MYKSYVVFFQCPRHRAGRFEIEEGVYAYVGSCGRSCIKRVARHLTRPARKRWHVDFLQCTPLYAVVTPLPEAEFARRLSSACPYVAGFGSTDDRESPSHLFRCGAEALLHAGFTI
ncbi:MULTISPECIES: GIY-YIG nuclease family protein [Pyrobaculum]|uniref:DUF123 domain-containing protein n=2 Tax=Pyrobaculum arsenaticum TaxID=121277 RepID=A4WM88_PYRAR|nr:DUF123 domain-containing protein [Pyrobaculum arsenaticum]ABP51505.1 conserved hypothetical protein [Pyrobaculum arsenaticum DSM 13514]MCY0890983.1 DUF123 domain-containing protein [Pyrobaculum arsenaticum]NYR16526.1 DUF123 domain-containing protein [Pyrobaculum arsenaticum]